MRMPWETFYGDEPQSYKMFKLFKQVVDKEKADGTFRPRRRGTPGPPFRPRRGRRAGIAGQSRP